MMRQVTLQELEQLKALGLPFKLWAEFPEFTEVPVRARIGRPPGSKDKNKEKVKWKRKHPQTMQQRKDSTLKNYGKEIQMICDDIRAKFSEEEIKAFRTVKPPFNGMVSPLFKMAQASNESFTRDAFRFACMELKIPHDVKTVDMLLRSDGLIS